MTVLLGVAHGSRNEASQDVVRALLAAAGELRPGLRTEAAYVDNASPSIRAALQSLVDEDVDDVVVLPCCSLPRRTPRRTSRPPSRPAAATTQGCGSDTAGRWARHQRWWRRLRAG